MGFQEQLLLLLLDYFLRLDETVTDSAPACVRQAVPTVSRQRVLGCSVLDNQLQFVLRRRLRPPLRHSVRTRVAAVCAPVLSLAPTPLLLLQLLLLLVLCRARGSRTRRRRHGHSKGF